MLPFLKRSTEGSASAPVESVERKSDSTEPEEYDGLESAMEELKDHLDKKDYKAAAECFRSAFQLCDLAPHEEGEHT